MKLNTKSKGFLMVMTSGVLWGTAFFYIQYLLDNGLTSRDLVSWKMLIGFSVMFIYTFFKDKSSLIIDRKGFVYMAIMALICHALYNLFIFIAIERTSIATTVALLYTAPVFELWLS